MLIPLYVYPSESAWAPIITAASKMCILYLPSFSFLSSITLHNVHIFFPLLPFHLIHPFSITNFDKLAIISIINPSSGPLYPGTSPHYPLDATSYAQGITSLTYAGVSVIGYISTAYGARDITLVKVFILFLSFIFFVVFFLFYCVCINLF